jgi:hypothetical protein
MAMKKTSGGDSPLRQGAGKSFWTLPIFGSAAAADRDDNCDVNYPGSIVTCTFHLHAEQRMGGVAGKLVLREVQRGR